MNYRIEFQYSFHDYMNELRFINFKRKHGVYDFLYWSVIASPVLAFLIVDERSYSHNTHVFLITFSTVYLMAVVSLGYLSRGLVIRWRRRLFRHSGGIPTVVYVTDRGVSVNTSDFQTSYQWNAFVSVEMYAGSIYFTSRNGTALSLPKCALDQSSAPAIVSESQAAIAASTSVLHSRRQGT